MLLKTNDVFTILKPLDQDGEDVQGVPWVVTGTEFSGGGTGHGPHDVYPDGHGVHAVAIDGAGTPTGRKFFFRQSGCFNNILEPKDVEIVGTATPTYKLQLDGNIAFFVPLASVGLPICVHCRANGKCFDCEPVWTLDCKNYTPERDLTPAEEAIRAKGVAQ